MTEKLLFFWFCLTDPVSLVRDHGVKQGLAECGISVHTSNGDLLNEPWEVYDDEGQAFTVFNAYWQKSLNMPAGPEAPLLPPRRLTGPIGEAFWKVLLLLYLNESCAFCVKQVCICCLFIPVFFSDVFVVF